MTNQEILVSKKFGKTLAESEIDYMANIDRLQDKLKGRMKCTMTFKNNLRGGDYTIKYLKLGHVIDGYECLVYERTSIKQNRPLHIDNYVIGTNTGHISGENKIEAKKISHNNKRDVDNVYDKLYVQFSIEKNINGELKEIVYNQECEQFLKENYLTFCGQQPSYYPTNGRTYEHPIVF